MIHIEQKELGQPFSEYMARVRHGETLVITDEAEPIAEIRPLATTSPTVDRQIGWAKGLIEIPDSFFDPLPDDELELWDGGGP